MNEMTHATVLIAMNLKSVLLSMNVTTGLHVTIAVNRILPLDLHCAVEQWI